AHAAVELGVREADHRLHFVELGPHFPAMSFAVAFALAVKGAQALGHELDPRTQAVGDDAEVPLDLVGRLAIHAVLIPHARSPGSRNSIVTRRGSRGATRPGSGWRRRAGWRSLGG